MYFTTSYVSVSITEFLYFLFYNVLRLFNFAWMYSCKALGKPVFNFIINTVNYQGWAFQLSGTITLFIQERAPPQTTLQWRCA